MALEKIVVEIGGKSTELDGTLAQLERLGIIDKKNSEQFKKSHSEHNAAIRETEGEMGRLENRMRSVAEKIVAVFAVERIFEFASESVKAFEEAEAAAKKLEFAVVNINGGTKKSFNELIEQSEKLSASLNNLFTPKQIQSAQTQLANFGLTTKQIKELIPRILDLSRATGKDLNEATEKSILAINGQTKGLRDVGISFKDTGSKTENLAKLMGDLNKFTGAAADSLNTFSGQAQSSANNIEILQEKVGKDFAPIWEGFKRGALEAADGLLTLTRAAFGLHDEYTMNTATLEYFNKLTNKQLAEAIKAETAHLVEMKKEGQEYTDQVSKVKQLIELAKKRTEVEKKQPEEKIKDDLTLKGEADAEAAAKKRAEEKKKREEEEAKRRVDDIHAAMKGNAEYDKYLEEQNAKKVKDAQDEADEIRKINEESAMLTGELMRKQKEESEKIQKETLKKMFEVTQTFFESLQQASEMNVTSLESQQKIQQSMIDTQRVLAEKGLANDLAFEERRQAELEKKKQNELKKQKRMKELSILLNSIEKFSEENPKTALAKALGVLAATKAAEAVFAEEGGILTAGGLQKSWSGRRHASGKDLLVHAEEGEGMLSRREMNVLGKSGFFALKSYLKNPIRERDIPVAKMFNNDGVISRLESLEKTIKERPVSHIEWDGLESRLETIVKNGITERTRHIRRPL